MNFLNAKYVRLNKHYCNRMVSTPIFTTAQTNQTFYIDSGRCIALEKVEVIVAFDKEQSVPKKLSISVNQRTMNPMETEVSLFKFGARKPYITKKMEELRTIASFDANTNRLVITFYSDGSAKNDVDVSLWVNYVEY